LIHFVQQQPQNSTEVGGGYLRVTNVNNPTVARLVLTIPQGEYIMREIISRVVLWKLAHPELAQLYDLDEIFYTLGEPQTEADFGTYLVPVRVYVQSRP
jgi:hypothetical protein